MMKTSDFDYYLPEELIAQTPASPRDSSRLLVFDRKEDKIYHKHFYDIVDFLKPGDLLVRNNTKVLPARLFGYTSHGGKVEVLLLKRFDLTEWEVLVKPGKKAKEGSEGFTVMKGVLANLASTAITACISGLAKLGGAFINVGKDAIASYAEFEQLEGGVNKIFGEDEED